MSRLFSRISHQPRRMVSTHLAERSRDGNVVDHIAAPSRLIFEPTDEAKLVQSADMQYINIPVDFRQPLLSDLQEFIHVMQDNQNKCKLVHCAYNWRVSSFVYLYRVLVEHQDQLQAQQDMLAIWQPDDTWQSFIDDCLAHPEMLESSQ